MAKAKKLKINDDPVVVPAVASDTNALRAYLTSLWLPVATFFEGRFVWLALVPIGVWLYIDRALVKTWVGLLLGIVILAGLALQLRKILMPKIDLQAAAAKAQEDPVGAAMVFLGGVAFMIAIIVAGVLWLGGLKG